MKSPPQHLIKRCSSRKDGTGVPIITADAPFAPTYGVAGEYPQKVGNGYVPVVDAVEMAPVDEVRAEERDTNGKI